MLEALRTLIGSPPAGLEFIEYLVLVGFVVASIYFVYKIISIIFNIFYRGFFIWKLLQVLLPL